MSNIEKRQKKANELRKQGKHKEALEIYRQLWRESGDKFAGAGLLHCLRKLKLFDEAITFADELIIKHPDFQWSRIEVIWTYIQGLLDKLGDDEPLGNVVDLADRIMDLKPDGLAAKKIVFKVLKSAKAHNDWTTINEWTSRIDPASLSTTPMTNEHGRAGWCDQALWYNYRINSLIENGTDEEAIKVVNEVVDRFPKQKKFFLRLKGLAYYHLKSFSKADKIYQNLCSGRRVDWWLRHEYAIVKRDTGFKEEALKLMYMAASSCQKLESLVTLYADIGRLCKEMGKYEVARAHMSLCKQIRNQQGWSIPESISDAINELNSLMGNNDEPGTMQQALKICQDEWHEVLGEKIQRKRQYREKRDVKISLVGKINLGPNTRDFCFITTDNGQSIFCHKSNLPPNISDKIEVTFDVAPSYDKKKKRESWRAINIKIKNES